MHNVLTYVHASDSKDLFIKEMLIALTKNFMFLLIVSLTMFYKHLTILLVLILEKSK